MNVQALALQAAVPFWLLAPEMATLTVVFTPAAVVHTPPIVLTVVFVMNGNVRTVPFTEVSVTVGAAVLMTIVCAPLVPVLPAVSDWVADYRQFWERRLDRLEAYLIRTQRKARSHARRRK